MAFRECRNFIKGRFDLNDVDADEIVADLAKLMKRRPAEGRGAADLRASAQERADAFRRSANAERQQAELKAIRKSEARDFIFGGGNIFDNFEAFLVGTPKAIAGGMRSIDALQNSLTRGVWGRVLNDLEAGHEGLTKQLLNDDFSKDVIREMWSLPEGKSVTGNGDAFHAAQVFEKAKESLRVLANEEGANIGRLPGHTFAQNHDTRALTRATQEKWIADILPRLDIDRTFGADNPTEVLQEIYKSIIAGRHPRRPGAELATGPAALANKLSRQRVLHFNSADDFLAYHDVYGGRMKPITAIFTQLERRADDIALMQRLGPDPDKAFATLLEKAKNAQRAKGKPMLPRKARALENRYQVVSRNDLQGGDIMLRTVTSNLKALQNVSKLGSAMIASFADMAFAASNARFNGMGLFTPTFELYANLLTGRSKGEVRQIARMLGVGFDGMLGGVARRFNVTDGLPGHMANLQTKFFKFNGLAWWTDVMQEGFALMSSRHLADSLGTAFGKLDDRLRNVMRLYDIGEADWKLMQRAGADEIESGAKYLTPDSLRKLEGMEGGSALEDKLRAYFINESHIAVPTPGARERAIAMQGLQRGSVPGSVAELFWQFKMFPLTVITKVYQRLGHQDRSGLALTAMMSTMFGYVAMSAKDILRGRSVRDADNPKTWAAAIQYGGGAGILGDLIFNDFRIHGRGFLQTAAGPTFGTVEDILRLYSAAVRGDDAAAQTFRVLVNNAPFSNLYYTRGALDYLFVYNVQEALNPGFLRRMERRVEREQNQGFLLRPSEVVAFGGGLR